MSTAGGVSTGSMCGLSRRLRGSHGQGSSGKWDVRSQFSPVPLPQGWTSPAAPLELLSWANHSRRRGAGWNHGRAVAIEAQGSGCHRGISLGVLRSLLWHFQGTKALQSPGADNHSLFQCRGPPPVPWGAEAQRFLKVGQNKTLWGLENLMALFSLVQNDSPELGSYPLFPAFGSAVGLIPARLCVPALPHCCFPGVLPAPRIPGTPTPLGMGAVGCPVGCMCWLVSPEWCRLVPKPCWGGRCGHGGVGFGRALGLPL